MMSALNNAWLRYLLVMVVMVGASLTTAAESNQKQLGTQKARQVAKVVGTPAGSIFLKGKYIEVGMHTLGSFGGEDPVNFSDGFHPLEQVTIDPQTSAPVSGILGFIVNPNGWKSPTDKPPYSGDFFVPGTPEEVWGVTWDYGASYENTVRFMNAGLVGSGGAGLVDIPVQVPPEAKFPTDDSKGNDQRATWRGTANHQASINGVTVSESLVITQTVHFDVNDQYFVMNVVMTNVGQNTIKRLRYLRSVDPDQEGSDPVNSTYRTLNYVVYQPQRGSQQGYPAGNVDKALVVGKGVSVNGVPLGLGTIDARARVAYGGFSNRDPLGVLNLGSDVDGNVLEDTAHTAQEAVSGGADVAISLAFDLGDLAPGQSVSIDYAYVLKESDLDTALGQLGMVSILQPTGTVSGNSALFQVSTNNLNAATTKVDFYVAGTLVGTDTTPGVGSTYDVTFNTSALANGPVSILAVATFADRTTSSKSASVTVDNSGPPIVFIDPTPASGSEVSGFGIPVEVSAPDAENQPVLVTIFLEYSGQSTAIGQFTQAPYATTFDPPNLPAGTALTLKAVARNGSQATTTILRQLLSPVAHVDAPVIALSSGNQTIYTAMSPSTPEGITSVLAALSGRPNTITRAFAWDKDLQKYTDLAQELPGAGILSETGIFIATRTPLNYSLNGTATQLPYSLSLKQNGWTFAGIPAIEVSPGVFETNFVWPYIGNVIVSGTPLQVSFLSDYSVADAMGTPGSGDDTTSRPWFWNGSSYVQVNTLKSGEGYWFKNNLPSEDILIQPYVPAGAGLAARRSALPPIRSKTGASAPPLRDHGSPPPPPSSSHAAASSSSGGCGAGSGIASLAFLMLMIGFRFLVVRR
jgi:hypothetical protein